MGKILFKDELPLKGKVEIFVSKGKPTFHRGKQVKRSGLLLQLEEAGKIPKAYTSCDIDFSKVKLLSRQVLRNIIVNGGKDKTIESYTSGFIHVIGRMAIGDRGTIPSDSTVPKVPVDTMDALYNEIYRDDIDTTVLDIGTPTVHEVKFIKAFSATDVAITAFSNQASPAVNEVGLITANIYGGGLPLPRGPVTAPDLPDADEELFAMRTFKSVPFEAANQIEITVRYTIFVE